MALAAPTMPTVGNANTGVAIASAAFTPIAGALLVVYTGSRAAVLPGTPTIDVNAGITWTQLTSPTDGLYDLGTGTRFRALAWAGVAPTATSMQVVTRSTSAARMSLMVVQVTGHGGLPSNAQAAVNGSGNPTITLPLTPVATSVVLAFVSGAGTTAGGTTPSGFIQLDNNTDAAGISWHCCYDLVGPPASVAYSTTYNQSTGIAVEVAEASVGASRVPRRPGSRFSHMLIR